MSCPILEIEQCERLLSISQGKSGFREQWLTFGDPHGIFEDRDLRTDHRGDVAAPFLVIDCNIAKASLEVQKDLIPVMVNPNNRWSINTATLFTHA